MVDGKLFSLKAFNFIFFQLDSRWKLYVFIVDAILQNICGLKDRHLLLCGIEEEYRGCFCLISYIVSCVMKARAETIQRATVEVSRLRFFFVPE